MELKSITVTIVWFLLSLSFDITNNNINESRSYAADFEVQTCRKNGRSLTSSSSSSSSSSNINPLVITKIAFGSCHKRKWVNVTGDNIIIWDTIRTERPHIFLWTGDAVYPPSRRIAPTIQLQEEYQQMIVNKSIGYANFQPPYGIYGTWDDHDYGGNDAGKELRNKQERRRLFFNFMNYSPQFQSKFENRTGLYHSIDFVSSALTSADLDGTSKNSNRDDDEHDPICDYERVVKVIVLDTRWNRDPHCIPSVAAKVPLGAALSCLTRWFMAGIGMPSQLCSSSTPTVLGEEQWDWLSHELETSTAQVHIIISSIQVLSTNPAMEGWGHFPKEQERLLELLNSKHPSGLVLLSGDVHHAEILDPAPKRFKTSFLEVTSSGLTHSCTMPFYGKLCEPLLKKFHHHRRQFNDYFLDRNYGTLEIDWTNRRLEIGIKNKIGETVLTTGWRGFDWEPLSSNELKHVAHAVDGHLIPLLRLICLVITVIGMAILLQVRNWKKFACASTSQTQEGRKLNLSKMKTTKKD